MANRTEIETALRRLAPRMPKHEFGAVVDHALDSRGLRGAAAETAAWLSLVAYVRHALTDYDACWRRATIRTALGSSSPAIWKGCWRCGACGVR
jgi:hypothetical protein